MVRKLHFFTIAFVNSSFHCYWTLKYGCVCLTDVNVLIIRFRLQKMLIICLFQHSYLYKQLLVSLKVFYCNWTLIFREYDSLNRVNWIYIGIPMCHRNRICLKNVVFCKVQCIVVGLEFEHLKVRYIKKIAER